jgi:hypothetical protein
VRQYDEAATAFARSAKVEEVAPRMRQRARQPLRSCARRGSGAEEVINSGKTDQRSGESLQSSRRKSPATAHTDCPGWPGEFERELIRTRTGEGRKSAMARGL